MPPEILQILIKGEGDFSHLEEYPWSIDVWSLGCILLEILTGVPFWIKYKCILNDDISNIKYSIYGVKEHYLDRI